MKFTPPIPKMAAIPFICGFLIVLVPAVSGAKDNFRKWTDRTGRFTVVGKLLKATDQTVFVQNQNGKKIKVPRRRLSKKDQDYLRKLHKSPFEVITPTDTSASLKKPRTKKQLRYAVSPSWPAEKKPDWNSVLLHSFDVGVQWNVPVVDGRLSFQTKSAELKQKKNVFEKTNPVVVNTRCKRAICSTILSSFVPNPLTRISLVDLVTGLAVHSDVIESNMRPVALLDDGNTLVMAGRGDSKSKFEKSGEIQLWQFDGKKVVRSKSWIPFPEEDNSWGKKKDAGVFLCSVIQDSVIVLVSTRGHVVVLDIVRTKPLWHTRVSPKNLGMDLSVDRSLMALYDDGILTVVNPLSGKVLASIEAPKERAGGWAGIAWSPSGKRLMLKSSKGIAVIDVQTGKWIYSFGDRKFGVTTNTPLGYPDDDYALINGNLLVYLPKAIKVCAYQNGGTISCVGGVCFATTQSDKRGKFLPLTIPHPSAVQKLEIAREDPSLFLIYPGVEVTVDASKVNSTDRSAVIDGLKKSIKNAGYQFKKTAAIRITAAITGPKTEAVQYSRFGIGPNSDAYVFNRYTSSFSVTWEGKTLWKASGSNVPQTLRPRDGQSAEAFLKEAGKRPNIAFFAQQRFPKIMQRSFRPDGTPRPGSAILEAKVTRKGIKDIP